MAGALMLAKRLVMSDVDSWNPKIALYLDQLEPHAL
jgi:hypothetical protein